MIVRGYYHRADRMAGSLQINEEDRPPLEADPEYLRRGHGVPVGSIHPHENKPLDLIIGFHRLPASVIPLSSIQENVYSK